MTLVIIDMQPCYKASNFKRVCRTVAKEIKLAIEKRRPIIVVEFDAGGLYFPTHAWLLEMVQEYNRFQLVTKSGDDGGREVLNCIRNQGYRMPVKVCGVNWEACVFETVKTLSKHGKVQVVREGCGSWRKQYDWTLYKGVRNVQVV